MIHESSLKTRLHNSMIFDLKEDFKMMGESGEEYTFKMFGFSNFDELQEFFKDYNSPGLYVFAKRSKSSVGSYFVHDPIYLGQTGNFNDRNFAAHHKRGEIEALNVHSIGIMITDGISDEKRKEMEKDLLSINDLRLNTVNNCYPNRH